MINSKPVSTLYVITHGTWRVMGLSRISKYFRRSIGDYSKTYKRKFSVINGSYIVRKSGIRIIYTDTIRTRSARCQNRASFSKTYKYMGYGFSTMVEDMLDNEYDDSNYDENGSYYYGDNRYD